LAERRHLVKVLRRARNELASCKARWRTTLRPALAPTGAPLPNRLCVELPPGLQAWERPARGYPAPPQGRLPLGLATACADLGAQVTAVQARIAALEQTLTPVAGRLPAYALLRTIPGIGPTVAAILLAEIGDIAWYTQFAQLRKLAGLDIVRVQSGQFAGQQRISKCGRRLLRWALVPGRGRPDPDRSGPRPARRGQGEAARGPVRRLQGHGRTRGETAPARGGVGRSGRPYEPRRAGGGPHQRR